MVSIIMPTYNRAYIIERAIKSVLAQTYEDWELIIVDDGSTDNTEQVVAKYLSSKVRYYVNEKNMGANTSRNRGVEYARGELLAFLDSDNYWPEYKLRLQIEMWENCKKKRCFLYGKVQIVNDKKVIISPQKVMTSEELKRTEMLGNVLDMNTILVGKDIFEEIGGFDEELPRFQDWELVLRMMYHYNVEALGSEECLSFNEIQENSIGRDASKYVKACGSIVKKYMCSYLSEKEIIDYLLGIWNEGKDHLELTKKILCEIGEENPQLISEAIRLIVNLQENIRMHDDVMQIQRKKLTVSHDMERLLYLWHEKNSCYKENTLFSKYFYEGGDIRNIAIYGLGKLGELFYREVKLLPINIVYGIDKNKKQFEDLQVVYPEKGLQEVDIIVVAVISDAQEIRNELKNIYKGEIVLLSELVERA